MTSGKMANDGTHRAQQQGQRGERKALVAEAVVQHRVVVGGGAEERQEDEHDHDPADRVARLAPRDHQPHPGKGQVSDRSDPTLRTARPGQQYGDGGQH